SDAGEIYVVKSKNVQGQAVDIEGCDRTSRSAWQKAAARLQEGDLVINSTGRGTLGRAAFVPATERKVVGAVDVTIWRLDPKKLLSVYATLFLNSPAGLAQSEQCQTGSSGQLHLYPR